ncbi:hypothetical protein GCM10009551_096010 [Nocardiopsis tropica]
MKTASMFAPTKGVQRMRTSLIALGAAVASVAALAGVSAGSAAAAPVSCPELPQDVIDGALRTVDPPLPGKPGRSRRWAAPSTARSTGSRSAFTAP